MNKVPTQKRKSMDTGTFDQHESSVASYGKSFPRVFNKASGSYIYDVDGGAYLDFLAGAGSLNYGHNHPFLANTLASYITDGGIVHSLDLHTKAKQKFLNALHEIILEPRGLDYVAQFTGPTGTNAVEAALKLARRLKGRTTVVSFTNGFHGVSLGALAATGNYYHRSAAQMPLTGVIPMPYDGFMRDDMDTLAFFEQMVTDHSSGLDHPAAVILETVQGEGGLNTASMQWLRRLREICDRHDMVMIVDDIQAGCGRTGTYFSFEPAEIKPDIITLSKSLSGFGLPMAITLIRRELDEWQPGEHNGTFRGHNYAFVTAAAAIEHFWSDDTFAKDVVRKSGLLNERLTEIVASIPGHGLRVKGRGMMQGLDCVDGKTATAVSQAAYRRGLIIETSGPDGEVVKCLCPLTISDEDLEKGLKIVHDSAAEVLGAAS